MGFYHVGQAGLKLLTSGDPPALASQSVAIIGMSHQFWPLYSVYIFQTWSHCCPGWSEDYGSLQPWPPGLKQSSCLSFPNSCNYRHAPSCPANSFYIFLKRQGFAILPRLILNSWAQAILPSTHLILPKAGITSIRYCTWPTLFVLFIFFSLR